jgi:hypothetical protein
MEYDSNLPAFAFSFKDEGKELLRITRDGRLLWFGDQSEAIKAFWDACEKMNPLRARVEELEDRIRDMGLVP